MSRKGKFAARFRGHSLGPAIRLACGILAALLGAASFAQERTVYEDYDTLISGSKAVAPLGPDVFGDSTDYYTGSTTFFVTDVSLRGNSDLDVSFSRSMEAFDSGLRHTWQWSRFEVPYLSGIFPQGSRSISLNGWYSGEPGQRSARCSKGQPGEVGASAGKDDRFFPEEYWHGNFRYLPGGGQALMLRAIATSPQPSAGGPFFWATADRWYFSCKPSTTNGAEGESFVGHAPDGKKYFFTHLVRTQEVDAIVKPAFLGGTSVLQRSEWKMLATRVEDQHGNWVAYEYDGPDLKSISANDGRKITIGYQSPGGRVAWVSDQVRTWTYGYDDGVKVTYPDGSAWHSRRSGPGLSTHLPQTCVAGGLSSRYSGESTLTISLSSGAVGTFQFRPYRRGLSHVPMNRAATSCFDNPQNVFDNIALVSKRIEGPGLPQMSWSMDYGPANDCYTNDWPKPCTASSPVTRTVDVVSPASVTRYVFGNKYEDTDGALLEAHTGPTAQSPLKSEYMTWSVLPPFGDNLVAAGSGYLAMLERLLDKKSIVQDGVTYNSVVTSRDVLRRPIVTVESNSTGASRTRDSSFYDNLAVWRMGQSASEAIDGVQVSSTSYLPSNALPFQTFSFGKRVQTLTYNADGTIASVTDGNDHVTSFSNWKRGIAQSIRQPSTPESPAGAAQSAQVDDAGQIRSTRDEVGATTSYAYDAMGRLKKTTPPVGDVISWSATDYTFSQVGTDEYGIASGHWKQTTSTGLGRKETYYDGLWRPLLIREYDASDVAGTQRYRVFAYDHAGRTTFESYPSTSVSSVSALSQGVHTKYDALGRIVETLQDSELGPLRNTVAYLPGARTLAINPRKNETTTSYQNFGEPNYQLPISIEAGGARTDIVRDVFGKPQRIERYGTP